MSKFDSYTECVLIEKYLLSDKIDYPFLSSLFCCVGLFNNFRISKYILLYIPRHQK